MLGGGNGIAERRVHHDDAARGGSRNVDIVDADAGTADNFQVLGLFENLGGYFSGRANGEPVVIADDLGQLFLVLAKTGLEIDLDAAILENLHRGGGKRVGDENFGDCHGYAAFGSAALASAKAQSSQGVSASTSARSTVQPHQIRRLGGASR